MGKVEKNIEFVNEEFAYLIEQGIKYTQELANNLIPGAIGLFLNPLVKVIFSWLAMDKAKKEGFAQLEYTLKSAAQCLEKPIEEVIEKNFLEYLKYNIVYRRSNHNHKYYHRLEELMKEGFRIRLELYSQMLSAEGDSYEEILQNAFPKRDDLEKLIESQFKVVNKAQDLVEKEPALIKVPLIARKEILHIIKSAYAQEKKLLLQRIKRIYQSKEFAY